MLFGVILDKLGLALFGHFSRNWIGVLGVLISLCTCPIIAQYTTGKSTPVEPRVRAVHDVQTYTVSPINADRFEHRVQLEL